MKELTSAPATAPGKEEDVWYMDKHSLKCQQ